MAHQLRDLLVEELSLCRTKYLRNILYYVLLTEWLLSIRSGCFSTIHLKSISWSKKLDYYLELFWSSCSIIGKPKDLWCIKSEKFSQWYVENLDFWWFLPYWTLKMASKMLLYFSLPNLFHVELNQTVLKMPMIFEMICKQRQTTWIL